jgi:hypothetical protein
MDVASPEKAGLDLQQAKIGTLCNPCKSWPGHLLLAGLVYDDIDQIFSRDDVEVQLQWIRRQPLNSRFSAQPYEQFSSFLRKMGREKEAKKVMIAQNEDRGRGVRVHADGLQEWLWYNVIGKAIGYGYRRGRPFLFSVAVIGFGWLLFGVGYRNGLITPTDDKAYVDGKHRLSEFYPKFDAFVYSVESFVPLVKLGISDHWTPNANRSLCIGSFSFPSAGSWLRGYLWLHMIAGWVLSALWVGGITGLVKS